MAELRLDPDALQVVAERLKAAVLENYAHSVLETHTGTLRRAIQQGEVSITERDGKVTLTLQLADIPRPNRPGQRQPVSTGRYAPLVIEGRGPIIEVGPHPMKFFTKGRWVTTHSVAGFEGAPILDLTPAQEQDIVKGLEPVIRDSITQALAAIGEDRKIP